MEQYTFIKPDNTKYDTQWIPLQLIEDWHKGKVEKNIKSIMAEIADAYRKFNLPITFELDEEGLRWRIDPEKCKIKIEILGQSLDNGYTQHVSDETLAEIIQLYMGRGVNGRQGFIGGEESVDPDYTNALKEIISMINNLK